MDLVTLLFALEKGLGLACAGLIVAVWRRRALKREAAAHQAKIDEKIQEAQRKIDALEKASESIED